MAKVRTQEEEQQHFVRAVQRKHQQRRRVYQAFEVLHACSEAHEYLLELESVIDTSSAHYTEYAAIDAAIQYWVGVSHSMDKRREVPWPML